MTPRIREDFSARFIDWSPFVIVGNAMPPRDPNEDEEDDDEEEEDRADEPPTAPIAARETFRKTLENFMNKMVTVHGFSPEEARYIVKGELQLAYDERFRSRHFAESDADGAEGEGEIEVMQETSQNARNRLSVRRHSDGPEDSKRLGN